MDIEESDAVAISKYDHVWYEISNVRIIYHDKEGDSESDNG